MRLRYLLRGFRVLAANARFGGVEVDLVMRRGRRLVLCEVKAKGGADFGDPLEMVGEQKARRLLRAAEAFLATHPEHARCELALEVVAVRGTKVSRPVVLVL